MHDKLKVWSELELKYVLLFCKECSDFMNYHLLIVLCSFEYCGKPNFYIGNVENNYDLKLL